MKRRHPRQVADPGELRVGEMYALVRTSYATDAPRQVFISCERMRFVAALDNGEMHKAMAALDDSPATDGEIRLTTHDIHGAIVIAIWRPDAALEASRPFAEYLGDTVGNWRDPGPSHQFFAPLADWDADPRVHVIDWLNPDDVCEAGLTWAEEEAKLKRRRDAAMRKALGFDE